MVREGVATAADAKKRKILRSTIDGSQKDCQLTPHWLKWQTSEHIGGGRMMQQDWGGKS